jgi:hypothetical protein
VTPPYYCAIQCLPRNLATHGAERSEEKEGEARRGSAALDCCCVIAFLEVSAVQHLPLVANTPQYFDTSSRSVARQRQTKAYY